MGSRSVRLTERTNPGSNEIGRIRRPRRECRTECWIELVAGEHEGRQRVVQGESNSACAVGE